MSPEGKVRVLVRSRRVPARTVTISRPIVSAGLIVGTQTTMAVVYENSFDDHHRRAIKEARKLSCSLDLDLEIVDRARSNPLIRLISALVGGQSASPSLTVEPLSQV